MVFIDDQVLEIIKETYGLKEDNKMSNQNNIQLSIIIPVYNRLNELRMTLASLTRQTLPFTDFEICIADDGSSEDVSSLIAEFRRAFPAMQIKYADQEDRGYRVAAARNLGADLATGRLWVYSDNGIILKSSVLETHIKHHDANEENLVILGNMHGTGWGTDENRLRQILDANPFDYDAAIAAMKAEGFGDGRTIRYIFDRFSYDIDSWYIPWLALWSGHFSVNAGFVKKHGIRWNERFNTWGGEDNEYGIQLCEVGGSLQFFADIEVAHYPTPGSKAVNIGDKEEFKRNYQKTKELILELHPTREVETWFCIGGEANDPAEREKLFKAKGWE